MLEQYMMILLGDLAHHGACNAKIEGAKDLGHARAVLAASADWADRSDMNPGHIRLYTFEQNANFDIIYTEIGRGVPVDMADFDAIASAV
jgi:hypothetical protein